MTIMHYTRYSSLDPSLQRLPSSLITSTECSQAGLQLPRDSYLLIQNPRSKTVMLALASNAQQLILPYKAEQKMIKTGSVVANLAV